MMDPKVPPEFHVNEYITLRFEKEKTNIYVKGRFFNQCKYILLNIPKEKIADYDQIESIDEAAEKLDHSEHPVLNAPPSQIPPKVAFWGHCSNLQAWAEHDYDTRLLHRNLAFPLLRKLTDVGDPAARHAFKEEIALRFISGNTTVVQYLIAEKYLSYLNLDEILGIIDTMVDHESLVQVCYNLLKNENDLYSISLSDKFRELDHSKLRILIKLILELILIEKKHVWGMEKLGGDFHSIQMKILIKMKAEYKNLLHGNINSPIWFGELQEFFKHIYDLTFKVINALNSNSEGISRTKFDDQFNKIYKKTILTGS